jgi:hypothetical protein
MNSDWSPLTETIMSAQKQRKCEWNDVIDKLIAAGADVNEQDGDNVISLFQAAERRYVWITKRPWEHDLTPDT